jgi:hypothetical protein
VSRADPAIEALERALNEAVVAKEWARVAILAREMANREEALAAENVVPLFARRKSSLRQVSCTSTRRWPRLSSSDVQQRSSPGCHPLRLEDPLELRDRFELATANLGTV